MVSSTKILTALISIATLVVATACGPVHHNKKKVSSVVHTYKVPVADTNDDGVNDFIFWYIIFSDNATYTYRSTVPVTSFADVSFTRSEGKSIPEEVQEEIQNVEQEPEVTLEGTGEVPEAIEAEAEASMDSSEMAGDGPNDSSTTDSSDSGSSFDSGGSSDGGGGGDSGGGGGE